MPSCPPLLIVRHAVVNITPDSTHPDSHHDRQGRDGRRTQAVSIRLRSPRRPSLDTIDSLHEAEWEIHADHVHRLHADSGAPAANAPGSMMPYSRAPKDAELHRTTHRISLRARSAVRVHRIGAVE
jgi:hypothetical protein